MSALTLLYLVCLGTIPSLIWLSFFLKEDCEPEPRSLLAKTFLMGIIISPLAIVLQIIFNKLFAHLLGYSFSLADPSFFLWAAFVEEFIKFVAVWLIAMHSPEFDEPTDAMIYMITASLGFAAIENMLVFRQAIPSGFGVAFATLTLRFFGATLLHALSSALMGYFLALAWVLHEHRARLMIIGITLATLFHFTFNIVLASADNRALGLGISTFLLVVMAILVYLLFLKIRRRYCKITNFT